MSLDPNGLEKNPGPAVLAGEVAFGVRNLFRCWNKTRKRETQPRWTGGFSRAFGGSGQTLFSFYRDGAKRAEARAKQCR